MKKCVKQTSGLAMDEIYEALPIRTKQENEMLRDGC